MHRKTQTALSTELVLLSVLPPRGKTHQDEQYQEADKDQAALHPARCLSLLQGYVCSAIFIFHSHRSWPHWNQKLHIAPAAVSWGTTAPAASWVPAPATLCPCSIPAEKGFNVELFSLQSHPRAPRALGCAEGQTQHSPGRSLSPSPVCRLSRLDPHCPAKMTPPPARTLLRTSERLLCWLGREDAPAGPCLSCC